MSDDPVALYRRAADGAGAVMDAVTAAQLSGPTPCTEWTVQDLIDHMVGSTDYLVAALVGATPTPRSGATAADFHAGASAVRDGLGEIGALDRMCMSPLGFEWSLGQATAGTFMDTLLHTWDLASATGQDATMDPELVDACIVMFLPDMPERGRAGGIVGAEVRVPADASPQTRLLGAMGRRG
ncbi:MAG: TIGR03086 family metal-binding protein [Acidimicrobiia bacterium]